MNWEWLTLSSAITSALLTGLVRQYALSREILDIPNSRSLHSKPMPRGGGIAIAVTFLASVWVLERAKGIQLNYALAVSGAGALVALIGLLDDHKQLSVKWRLLTHVTAAGWAVAWLGGLPPLEILGMRFDLGWFGQILAIIYIVWLLNLYNFMDGIDGIAGLEAVTVGLGATLIYYYSHELPGDEWSMPAALAFAAGGFLLWNFPPAKIFMGDAGSGFLGLTFGLMSIHAATFESKLFWSWIVLIGAFVVDASVTLLRRLQRGDKLYEAHRNHAYQHAAMMIGSHRKVTLAVGMINVFWLLPIAYVVSAGWIDGVVGVLVAYAPLVWLAIRLGAGDACNAK